MTGEADPLTLAVDRELARLASLPPGRARLQGQLRLLAKWRSRLLAEAQVQRMGAVVTAGPFAGMVYSVGTTEGCRVPRLLGAYEASLHPVIEAVIRRAYPQVLDIGCAEGYYAVGLARRMPGSTVQARDTSPAARSACAALARANGVADRVQVGDTVTHVDLGLCERAPTVIVCDIEGAEAQLLDPGRAPGLRSADILVEVHEGTSPGLLATLADRFTPTHRVTRIDRALRPDLLPPWAEALSDLDRLLLLWEWRANPTPWLWMECR